ncbi:hypothetical protein BDR07DRAFT_1613914 [Suillus spraguei]|nr:hypothetical protein BDR07DRAFT_1613914 [Suillus spraguei]
MERQQFVDLEKVEGLVPESEEEEILSSNEASMEMLVVMLNWTMFSAMITGSIWWFKFNEPPPGSSVNVDAPTHEPQTPSLRYTLTQGVLFVGVSLSFCVVFLIVLSKIVMRQRTLTLRRPPDGPRRLSRSRIQSLRAIPASMPTWFMQFLKSLQYLFPLVQFVVTFALLALFWFF